MHSLWFSPCAAETDRFFLSSVKQKPGGGTETLSESYKCAVCAGLKANNEKIKTEKHAVVRNCS